MNRMNRLRTSGRVSRIVLAAAAILALCGGAAFAAEPVHAGVDLWMTVAGSAQTSFDKEPIPAGFFCDGSAAFTGRVYFKGVPIATEPVAALGDIDTVVRRLDDAAFDNRGEAVTRVQLMALSLASTRPIETRCGSYDVTASLAGRQPVTTMRIFRGDALGGTYTAPLALNVKLVFTPVSGEPSGRRELARRIDLGPGSKSVWAYVRAPQYPAGVRIDTRGDGRPDTLLPPSSNFLAGVKPAALGGEPARPRLRDRLQAACGSGYCPYETCHCDPTGTDPFESNTGCDHSHCIWVCVPFGDGGVTCCQGRTCYEGEHRQPQ